MRDLTKRAAALALAVIMTAALAGCGNSKAGFVSETSVQFTEAPNPLAEQITKSKVTSADSSAKSIQNSVECWIADNIASGGDEFTEGEVTIVSDNGKITVTGTISDADKAKANPKTLSQMLSEYYADVTFWAKVYIDERSRASSAVYVDGVTSADGIDIPGRNDFAADSFKWGDKLDGVTSSGDIVGTYPKLFTME